MTTAEGEMANWIEDDWYDVRLSRKREVKEKEKKKDGGGSVPVPKRNRME